MQIIGVLRCDHGRVQAWDVEAESPCDPVPEIEGCDECNVYVTPAWRWVPAEGDAPS